MLKLAAREDHRDWSTLMSNRHLLFMHPLLKFHGFDDSLDAGSTCNGNGFAETNEGNDCVSAWLRFAM